MHHGCIDQCTRVALQVTAWYHTQGVWGLISSVCILHALPWSLLWCTCSASCLSPPDRLQCMASRSLPGSVDAPGVFLHFVELCMSCCIRGGTSVAGGSSRRPRRLPPRCGTCIQARLGVWIPRQHASNEYIPSPPICPLLGFFGFFSKCPCRSLLYTMRPALALRVHALHAKQ